MSGWSLYYEQRGDKPNGAVASLLGRLEGDKRLALDLGAGNLRDANYLASHGFKQVVAVDPDPAAGKTVAPGVHFINMPAQAFRSSANVFDLVICCNTLFYFANKKEVESLFSEVFKCLVPGGTFFCNLLDEKDAYFAGTSPRFTRDEILKLCADFSLGESHEVRELDDRCFQWVLVLKK